MSDLFEPVIREKILASIEAPLPTWTRRDVARPDISGKAMTVIGMRRSGKTTFLHQCRRDLVEMGRARDRLVYFNFEDERLGGMGALDLGRIPEIHARLFPESSGEPVVLFLDEIQNVDGWEPFVRRLLDEGGYEVWLSGSSAKLLSQEVATSMRGRGWEIVMHPFSFREWLRHHGRAIPEVPSRLTSRKAAGLDHQFAEYLEVGGFPEAQGLGKVDRMRLLQGYVDVALLRDVIERHRVPNATALRWLTRRLLGAPGGLFSVTRFAADLKSQGISVGRETLYALLGHLEDAFLLHVAPVATDSEKRRQVNPRKVYPADPGLIPVYDRSAKKNLGQALEVAVFIELRRRGAEVSYVSTRDGFEVDFLARELSGETTLIQVCANFDDPVTLEREIRALESASVDYPEAKQALLTLESRTLYPETSKSVEVLPAWQWMLERRAD